MKHPASCAQQSRAHMYSKTAISKDCLALGNQTLLESHFIVEVVPDAAPEGSEEINVAMMGGGMGKNIGGWGA